MKYLLMTAALGAALVSTQALAQDQSGHGGFKKEQTRQEAQQRADMMFQMLDANRDGTVTKLEAEQALAQFEAARGGEGGHGVGRMQKMIEQGFAASNALTQQQFEAQMLARFDAMDLNHDGLVSPEEKEAARAQREAQKPGQ